LLSETSVHVVGDKPVDSAPHRLVVTMVRDNTVKYKLVEETGCGKVSGPDSK